MKIAIPVDQQSLESNVAANFGRAANFLFFDTESKVVEYIDNSAVMSQGGAGIKAAQSVVDHGAKAIITPRCGQNAVDVLNGAGIEMYQSIEGTAQINIDAYLKGNLSALTEIHAGFHHHG